MQKQRKKRIKYFVFPHFLHVQFVNARKCIFKKKKNAWRENLNMTNYNLQVIDVIFTFSCLRIFIFIERDL